MNKKIGAESPAFLFLIFECLSQGLFCFVYIKYFYAHRSPLGGVLLHSFTYEATEAQRERTCQSHMAESRTRLEPRSKTEVDAVYCLAGLPFLLCVGGVRIRVALGLRLRLDPCLHTWQL